MLHNSNCSWKYTPLRLLPFTMRPTFKRMCHFLLLSLLINGGSLVACVSYSNFHLFPIALSLSQRDKIMISATLTLNFPSPKGLLTNTQKNKNPPILKECALFSPFSQFRKCCLTHSLWETPGTTCWYSVRKWREKTCFLILINFRVMQF